MSESPETTAAKPIIKTWLAAIVDTASQRDHAAHMNLISKISASPVYQVLKILVLMTGLISANMNLRMS